MAAAMVTASAARDPADRCPGRVVVVAPPAP